MNASKRMKKTKRPDGRSTARLLAVTILKGVDFWVALIVGGGVGYLAYAGRIDGADFLPWLSGLGFTIAIGVWGAERWLDDRVPPSSDFGQLVGIVDPEGRALLQPYFVIELVAVTGGISAGIAGLVAGAVEGGTGAALVYGVPAWLLTWAVVGLVEIIVITHRHLRDQRELANLRAELKAEQRRQARARGKQRNG